jgi:hypothetical protein
MSSFPRLAQVVLDSTDVRCLAEFYREFLPLITETSFLPEALCTYTIFIFRQD